MKFILAENNQTDLMYSFIQNYEFSCCGLAAIIRKFSEPVYIITNKDQISSIQDIFGIFSFKHSIFHCLPDLSILDNEVQNQLKDFFKDKSVKSIIGERNGSDFFVNLLKNLNFIPEQTVYYNLMTLTQKPNPAPEALVNDDEIRRVNISDIEEIQPLQKEYLETEIAPVGRHITDLETKANLKQILKNQLCLALYSNDEPVAKVNTNAIGYKWVQIGGVFSHPMFRRNYYAWHLLFVLCNRILKTNRNPCLFVKEKNTGAFNLYKRIGFIEVGKFEICYLAEK